MDTSLTFSKTLFDKDSIDAYSWVPTIVFPLSHILQIIKIHKSTHVQDVSPFTFLFFFIGNMGGYLFTDRYFSIKVVMSYIITSILEIYIISLIYNKTDKKTEEHYYTTILSAVLLVVLIFAFLSTEINNIKKFKNNIAKSAGFLPALLFPIGTLLQLIKIIKNNSTRGVSMFLWVLMLFGNIGLYILSKKYLSWKSIVGFLGTGILNIMIIFYILYLKNFECI